MTGNDDKRHLHTKRQQVPETVTPHFHHADRRLWC
ncbi:hypothetical protein FORC64_1713 [Escherichia coli]|nr:hypothetical protein FORC64_1713 [Escherichia coli]CSP79505.1 Uncharacterised protein [Shigella sonnei]